MSLDEQHHALVSAFSKPYGQAEGPQVFEIKFDSDNTLFHWNRIAHANAEKLGIPIKTKQDGETLHVALLEGEHYSQLVEAMKSEVVEMMKAKEEYLQDLIECYEEHKSAHQASSDDYSHYER